MNISTVFTPKLPITACPFSYEDGCAVLVSQTQTGGQGSGPRRPAFIGLDDGPEPQRPPGDSGDVLCILRRAIALSLFLVRAAASGQPANVCPDCGQAMCSVCQRCCFCKDVDLPCAFLPDKQPVIPARRSLMPMAVFEEEEEYIQDWPPLCPILQGEAVENEATHLTTNEISGKEVAE